jgi:hypothetical protein
VAGALLGWRVVAIDDPTGQWARGVKELAEAWARPGLVGVLRAKSKGNPFLSLRAAPTAKHAGLPSGATHYVAEVTSPEPGAAGGKLLVGHILVVADATRTWLALGGDEALLADRLQGALGSGGAKLSTRGDLAGLKGASVGTGGFFSLRAVLGLGAFADAVSGSTGEEALGELARMTQNGLIAVPFTATADGKSPPSTATQLRVPRAVIEDAVGAIVRHGGF